MTSSLCPRRLLLLSLLVAIRPSQASSLDRSCLWRHTQWPSWQPASCPLPVDDTASTSFLLQHTPWSHRPLCTGPQPACVYALGDSSSTKGGLSLVTTSDAASDAAAAAAAAAAHVLLDETLPSSPPYVIGDIPGKGKSAVATRRIQRGESILAERPLMLARLDLFGGDHGEAHGHHQDDHRHHHHEYASLLNLLETALAQLPEPSQQVVHSLARFRRDGSVDDSDGTLVEDVLRTNGLGVSVGGVAHTGLYPQIAVGRENTVLFYVYQLTACRG